MAVGQAIKPESGSNYDIVVAIALLGIIAVMLIPLPTFLMDFTLSISICLGLVTFLVAIYLKNPLEFSVFPSLILVATLLRLSLNIASTRLILSKGADGPEAAGNVIKSFGQFVVGGNYVVGVILFLILVVINFVVITKGSGRIAEVAARFTLDAMPGKQMAIDADLNSGLITEDEARSRRTQIQDEASFNGAMDGASKFVRGDAVAGLVITVINIVAGFAVGMLQHDMSAGEAAETFTILTVGDGLVSQIPALLISTAAGIVVTRSADHTDLGSVLVTQLARYRRPAGIAAGFLFVIGMLPGMPSLIFVGLAAAVGGLAAFAPEIEEESKDPATEAGAPVDAAETEAETMKQLLPIDLLELEIGYELVTLVDGAKDGNLLGRIGGIRRQFATDLGLIVPPIHVRDNLNLRPSEYRLLLSGSEVGRGDVFVGQFLAMDPGTVGAEIEGEPVVEPAFGLPAKWVRGGDRSRAEVLGYTVVDVATVVATHISELLRKSAHDLLGRREAQELLDIFAKGNPNVVDELIPNLMPLGEVIKVLRNLLREGISIRDFRTILETLADSAAQVKDPDALTEIVRQRMAKQLTSRVLGPDGKVHALILEPGLEQDLREALRAGGAESASFDTQAIPRVLSALEKSSGKMAESPALPVLVVAPDIRPHVAGFSARHVPGLSVYSYREIEPNTPIHTLGVVGGAE